MSEKELKDEVMRLHQEVVDLKVDLNIKDAEIRQLKRDLEQARKEVRNCEIGTQTMRELQIVNDTDDDNGIDPRNTGKCKSLWGGATR